MSLSTLRRRATHLALAGLLAGTGLVVAAPAAWAEGTVTVTNEFGTAEADLNYSTPITVTGSGFQSLTGGFGGIYVVFGTVEANWRPSQGGATGSEYRYVPDTEDADNAGFQRFVAYPGSDTASAANGGVIDADGNWSLTMMIPGPVFQSFDRDNNAVTVNCLEVQCGIITFGAHGVANAGNETFTPVTFTDLYSDASPAGTDPDPAAPTAEQPAGTDDAAAPATDAPASPVETAPAAPAETVVADPTGTVDLDTAVVGRLLTFTGTGFRPGDQVIAALDDGLAAAGPFTAGPNGTIAGVLQLPPAAGPGTHILRLTVAGGEPVDLAFAVRADLTTTTAEPEVAPVAAADEQDRTWTPARIFLVAAIVLLVLVSALVMRRRLLRRPASAAPAEAEAVDDGGRR